MNLKADFSSLVQKFFLAFSRNTAFRSRFAGSLRGMLVLAIIGMGTLATVETASAQCTQGGSFDNSDCKETIRTLGCAWPCASGHCRITFGPLPGGWTMLSRNNTNGTFFIGTNAPPTSTLFVYSFDSINNCTSHMDWTYRYPDLTYPVINGTLPACPTVGQTYVYYARRYQNGYPGSTESISWTIQGGTIQGYASATILPYTYDSVKVQWNANGPHRLICQRFGQGTTVWGPQNCTNYDTIWDGGAAPPVIQGPSGICSGATTASYTASTFPAGFTYNWTCSNGSIVSGQGTQTVSVNWAGSGTLTLTRTAVSCGWTDAATKNVTYSASPAPTVNLGPNASYCTGTNVTLSAGGGFSTYRWSNLWTTPSVVVNTSGNYSVTVTNAAGCSAADTVTLNINGTISAPGWPANQSICAGASITPGSYTSYLWNTGATTASIVPATSGTYTVTVSNGVCSTSSSTNVTVNAAPAPNLGPNTTFCQGSNFTLYAGPGASYSWSTGATTQTIQPNASGTYAVTVTNAQGCTGNSSVTLTMLSQPVPTITYFPMVYCAGSSVTLNAGSWAAYQWSTGATTASITVTPPGSWSVTVTDFSGCTGSTTVNLTPIPGPNPSLPANQTVCPGTPIVFNPGPFSTYIWSTGATTQTISPTTSGTYTVTVSDANGCTGTASTVLTVLPAPTPNLGPNQSICAGNTTTLNPGTFSSYIWSTGATTQTIAVSTAGTYTVTVTDANGCTGTSSTTVSLLANPTPTIAQFPLIVCPGQTALLDAGIWASVLWSTGATTPSITVTPPGTWSVSVTDANGCTGAASINITLSPAPTFSLGADTFICADTFVTLNGPAGMSSYAWSTSATSASITVNTGSNYALTVTDANGCTASDDKLITGLTDCVFPGDANYDGIADNADILSIGAYYGFTGASRPGATLQWYGQSLANWGGALPGNADPKHSDCDGNGSVAAVDTQAVTLNYGLTHSKGAGVNGGPVQLTVRALADSIHPGDPAWFVVEMGDAQNVADSVYGIALRLTPSGNAMSVPGIFTVDYTNCWFAQALDRLDFTQPLGSNSPVDVAVVRNDQNEQSGFGEVFRFAVATDPNMIPIRDVLQVAVTNVTFVDANLSAMPLTVTNGSIVVSYLVTGVTQLAINPPLVFPNPTNGSVRISQNGTNAMEVTATDILGHSVKTLRNASGNSVLMDTDDLASGIYILRIQTDLGSYLRRLVVE